MLTRKIDEQAILRKIERHQAIYQIAEFLSYIKNKDIKFTYFFFIRLIERCVEGEFIDVEDYQVRVHRKQLLKKSFSGEDQKYLNLSLFLLAQFWPENEMDKDAYICPRSGRTLDLTNRLLLATGTQLHKIVLRYFDHAIDEYELYEDPITGVVLTEDHKALLRPELRKLNNFIKNPSTSAGQTAGMLMGFVCLIAVSACMLTLVSAIATLTPVLAGIAGIGIGLASAVCIYKFIERVVTYLKPYRSLEMDHLVNIYIPVIMHEAKEKLGPEIEKEKIKLANEIAREAARIAHREKLKAQREAQLEAREAKENPEHVAKRYADALKVYSLVQRSIWSDPNDINHAMQEEEMILQKMSLSS